MPIDDPLRKSLNMASVSTLVLSAAGGSRASDGHRMELHLIVKARAAELILANQGAPTRGAMVRRLAAQRNPP